MTLKKQEVVEAENHVLRRLGASPSRREGGRSESSARRWTEGRIQQGESAEETLRLPVLGSFRIKVCAWNDPENRTQTWLERMFDNVNNQHYNINITW